MSELEETLNDGEDILEEADGNNAALNFELDNNNQSFPSVRNDYPGNPSKKKQADNLNNSRPSNHGTQPLSTQPPLHGTVAPAPKRHHDDPVGSSYHRLQAPGRDASP